VAGIEEISGHRGHGYYKVKVFATQSPLNAIARSLSLSPIMLRNHKNSSPEAISVAV